MLPRIRHSLVAILTFAIGGLFIWAGLSKIYLPYDFLGAVYAYELVGPETGLLAAAILPWLEIVVGISLVLGVWKIGGSLLALGLSALFTWALASAAGQGLKIPCGCGAGSALPEFTSYWKVAQSALLFGATCIVFVSTILTSSDKKEALAPRMMKPVPDSH